MANFGNNFTDELRARLSIVDVVSRRVPLTKKGKDFWGCCPFHNEKTPSFKVNEDMGKFYCFGCGEKGDIISFVMKTQNMQYPEAIRELADMAGIKVPEYKPKSAEQLSAEQSYQEINEAACKIYMQKLFEESGAKAFEYIRGRGFDDEKIKKYKIGYAPRGNVIAGRFADRKTDELIASGLVRRGDNGTYDFFRDKLMFPITDARGNVIAFSGRSLDGSEPKYINTGETEFFKKSRTIFGLSFAREAIHINNRSIIVEGQIDAIQMQTNGFPETVAPLGTALTADHLTILSKLNRNITFCFDGDKAGKKAAARAVGLAMPVLRADSDIRFAFVTGGKDPDEILRTQPEAMKQIIDGSIPLADFLWNLVNEDFLIATPGGRAAAEKFLNTELEKIADPDLRKEFRMEYDQRKFNLWHKWRKSDGKTDSSVPVPAANSMVQKTLKAIMSQYPDLAQSETEFFISQGLDPFETHENSGSPLLDRATAEKTIRKLKISAYIDTLKKEMATATDAAQIAALNLEISKSAAALAKIDD